MISAGDLRDKIVVQRNIGTTINALNETVEAWAELATRFARRQDAASGEKDAAAQAGSFLMARFAVRRCAIVDGITPADRIVSDGAVWNIKEAKRLLDAPLKFIELTAVRELE